MPASETTTTTLCSHFGSRPFLVQFDVLFVVFREMVGRFLGPMLCVALVPLLPAGVLVTLGLVNTGATSSSGYVSPSFVDVLGGEDDFHAATPAAIACVAPFVGWPSFFVVDSPAAVMPMFAAFSGGSALLRCPFRSSSMIG